MLEFNDWVLAEHADTKPPMTLLDTTSATPAETAAQVAGLGLRTPPRHPIGCDATHLTCASTLLATASTRAYGRWCREEVTG